MYMFVSNFMLKCNVFTHIFWAIQLVRVFTLPERVGRTGGKCWQRGCPSCLSWRGWRDLSRRPRCHRCWTWRCTWDQRRKVTNWWDSGLSCPPHSLYYAGCDCNTTSTVATHQLLPTVSASPISSRGPLLWFLIIISLFGPVSFHWTVGDIYENRPQSLCIYIPLYTLFIYFYYIWRTFFPTWQRNHTWRKCSLD